MDARNSSCCFSVMAFHDSHSGKNPSLIFSCASRTPFSSGGGHAGLEAFQEAFLLIGQPLRNRFPRSRELPARFRGGLIRRFLEAMQLLPRVALNLVHECRGRGVRGFREQFARAINDSRTTSFIWFCVWPTKLRLEWSSSAANSAETSPARSRS